MATLNQEPNKWNLAYAPNVWTIGTLGSADQFLLRVYIEGTPQHVAEFRQPANPSGVAHFDVSKVLQSYLEPAFVEDTLLVSETPKETLTYRIQYGTVTGGIIDPTSLTYSFWKEVLNGYDDWRVLNWDDSDYNPIGSSIACESLGNGTEIAQPVNYLTNYPISSYKLSSSSYHTLSFFNRIKNWDDGTMWEGTSQQPAFVVIKYYDAINALIQTSIYSINETKGLGPRSDYNSNIQNTYTDDMIVGTVGTGPQNLKDAGLWPQSTTQFQIWNLITQTWNTNTNIWNLGGSVAQALVNYYTVDIYGVDQCYWNANGAPPNEDATTLQNYLGSLIYSKTFKVDDKCTQFDPITISFVNQYGVKDYVTFDRRNTKTVTSNRSVYTQSTGTWSDATYSINQHSGGKRVFNTDVETQVLLTSNWMTDEESIWLQELYSSPSAQIYIGGQWEPVVISSNMYEEKTYARDKMFQHSIVVNYSNNKRVQRG